ncbi:BSD domain [Dillenia turbinata]|uniref:BSD domain n=1 Tax=Dillenia turbinata TaxID=194707 RepID=A0AAN8VNP9_9MAGN
MNFIRSVFSEDPDPPIPNENTKPISNSSSDSPKTGNQNDPDQNSPSIRSSASSSNPVDAWSFGGIMKTLSSKSESMIEICRRDLKEFGTGLQKETALFREVASRAVKDLPSSIEVGASKIDQFGSSILKGTAEIISQGGEAIIAVDSEYEQKQSGASARYSRFDAQVRAIQSDVNTYVDEIEELDDFNKWRSGFVLDEEEIGNLLEDKVVGGIYKKVVPNVVDHETFWFRYFYKVHKLKQAEVVRANLVKRAISREDEEELSWDVDDDDEKGAGDEEEVNGSSAEQEGDSVENKEVGSGESSHNVKEKAVVDENVEKAKNVDNEEKRTAVETSTDEGVYMKSKLEEVSGVKNVEVSKSDAKVSVEGKAENGESSKDSDFSVVSSQPSVSEEDLEWDEIEDLGGHGEEKKVTTSGSPSKVDLRKRITAADDDEDLSWDIEDDDEPAFEDDTTEMFMDSTFLMMTPSTPDFDITIDDPLPIIPPRRSVHQLYRS